MMKRAVKQINKSVLLHHVVNLLIFKVYILYNITAFQIYCKTEPELRQLKIFKIISNWNYSVRRVIRTLKSLIQKQTRKTCVSCY